MILVKTLIRCLTKKLSSKLTSYGIAGNVKSWIENILQNRTQYVHVNSHFSTKTIVGSGVSQGSILGPVLFLIYINDLPEIVHSVVKIFADDTKIFRKVSQDNDNEILQNDLNSLFQWSQVWALNFNASKCIHVHMGNKSESPVYHMT